MSRRTLLAALKGRALALAALFASAACGGSATASLKLRNDTATHASPHALTGAFTAQAPSSFRMKLIAVYLAEDVDPTTQDNVGQTSIIWENPECQGDISGCNISGAVKGGPWAHQVKSFFEFARDSAAVNADLNSQGQAVSPGSYKYARLEFCKYGDGDPNVSWSAPQLSAPRAFSIPECGVTSKAFDKPIVLGKGDTVAVTLAYDLAAAGAIFTPNAPGAPCYGNAPDQKCYLDCGDAGNGQVACVNIPDFTPSASFVASADAGT